MFCRSMLASTFVAGFLGIFYFRLLALLPSYSARIAVDRARARMSAPGPFLCGSAASVVPPRCRRT